jgi:hypothetical protein
MAIFKLRGKKHFPSLSLVCSIWRLLETGAVAQAQLELCDLNQAKKLRPISCYPSVRHPSRRSAMVARPARTLTNNLTYT